MRIYRIPADSTKENKATLISSVYITKRSLQSRKSVAYMTQKAPANKWQSFLDENYNGSQAAYDAETAEQEKAMSSAAIITDNTYLCLTCGKDFEGKAKTCPFCDSKNVEKF